MSYTIEYNPQKKKRYPEKKKKSDKAVHVLFLLVLLAVAGIFVIKNRSLISQCYYDGLDMLAEEIMTGTKIGQTVSLYCSQLFEYAKAG